MLPSPKSCMMSQTKFGRIECGNLDIANHCGICIDARRDRAVFA